MKPIIYIRASLDEISKRYDATRPGQYRHFRRKVFPGNSIPVIIRTGSQNKIEYATWGYPCNTIVAHRENRKRFKKAPYQTRRVSIMHKQTIRQEIPLIRHDTAQFKIARDFRRCIIPCNGFYGSASRHQGPDILSLFYWPDIQLRSLAGIYIKDPKTGLFKVGLFSTEVKGTLSEWIDSGPLVLPANKERGWLGPNHYSELRTISYFRGIKKANLHLKVLGLKGSGNNIGWYPSEQMGAHNSHSLLELFD